MQQEIIPPMSWFGVVIFGAMANACDTTCLHYVDDVMLTCDFLTDESAYTHLLSTADHVARW